MGKLGIFSCEEVCAILQRHGFIEFRQKGSHIMMQKRTATGTRTVPVPNHREIAVGTLLSIIRQSGIDRTAFEK